MEPLFMEPVFQEKIWGGNRLETVFGLKIPTNRIGEDWAISGHKHGVSIIKNGPYKGQTLDVLWKEHRELFGGVEGEEFPLLVKILDAQEDLSVQVHPDDVYGLQHEGELGKTECWYVIDANPGAEIVYGHTAKSKEEFTEMITDQRWEDLFIHVPVKKGDFFFVPSGTIHAIGKGILILETQQSSDTTYRVYDYDRKDDSGNLRELHIQQSIDVTKIPAQPATLTISEKRQGNCSVITYVNTPFFTVYEWQVKGALTLKKKAPFTLATVIEGYGELIVDGQEFELTLGTSFILPAEITEWTIQGDLQLIASEPGEKLK